MAQAWQQAWGIQDVAAELGFDWPDICGPLAKVEEEVEEIREALARGDSQNARRELGDLLFAVINVARFLDADSAQELAYTNAKFTRRFNAVKKTVQDEGLEMRDCSLAKLDAIWEATKLSED